MGAAGLEATRWALTDGRAALPPVCILAGGLGTRLGDAVRETPKPLLKVAGEPFLIHQLRLLARVRSARESCSASATSAS